MNTIIKSGLVMLSLLHAFNIKSQDADQDSINDQLEQNLAVRFAPEWRFHKKVIGDGSNQNHTEQYYPSSIEWFYNKVVEVTGNPPLMGTGGSFGPIPNINQLDQMHVPGTNIPASDPFWGGCESGNLWMFYPEKLSGDPDGFPTYFHCYPLDNGRVSIGYGLFYPFDYKGSYCAIPSPFGCILEVEEGKHRGDWEGINVVVTGVNDYNDPASFSTAAIEYIKYSGHGAKKFIQAASPRFRSVWGTHPKVFIAWGAHANYPEPGEWHNWVLSGIKPNWYDDFFHGNGLVVQSWRPQRQLVNMGEKDYPMVGWLNYKGRWGQDDNGGNSSPPGPPCKSFWSGDIDGYVTWEEAMQNYGGAWEGNAEIDCSPELASPYSPDPAYGANTYVDCRVTCPGENPPLPTVLSGVYTVPTGGVLGIFPCHYPENIIINKSMTLKAIEGTVVIGQ